jgi:nucleotide-binding universal stress UspA family protein
MIEKETSMLPIKTILHPTDFSDASEHARRMAVGLARDYSARLILLHAVEPPIYSGEFVPNFAATVEGLNAEYEKLAALIEADSPLQVEPMTVEGIASPEILRIAREQHADLIVIGSHGRGGLGRVLMGSVAEEVSRKAPCPVLIVRPTHEVPHEVPTGAQHPAH